MSRVSAILSIALFAFSTAVNAQPASGVYVAPAMTKIKADHPELVRPDRTITVRAARREFESFQLVLVGPLSAVTPSSGGFVKQQGSSPVLPTMRFFREDLVTVTRKSSIDTTMDVNAAGAAVSTRLPDALVPGIDEVIGASRNAFGANLNVSAGEARAIWVDIFVPPGTSPGNYTGTINVSWTGGSTPINFTLEVWNFTLNATPALKTTSGISFWALPFGHPNVMVNGQPDPSRLAKLRARYGQLALDHHLSLGYQIDDGASVNDLAHFDTYYGPAFNGTLGPAPGYDPASIGTQISGTKLTSLRVVGTPSTWNQHFSTSLDRLYFYTCNEPPKYETSSQLTLLAPDRCGPPKGTTGAGWSGIPQLAAVAQSPNHIRSLVTTNITWANANAVTSGIDIFSTIINQMEVKSIDSDAIASGLAAAEHQGNYTTWLGQSSVTGFPHELWTYQSCMSHACNAAGFYHELFTGWPSYMIDADPVRARALEWLSFRYGAKGELYWETTANYISGTNPNDPWSNPWNPDFGGNGEGTLFYPGTPARIGGVSSVPGDIADIPIASIRLKMIREGVEDYEYMKMASDLSGDGGAWAQGLVRNVFPHAYDTNEPAATGDADRRPKSERLMDYRSQIAQRIRELTPNGLVLTNILVPHVTSNSAVITWTSDLKGDTQVKYGTTSGNLTLTTTLNTSQVTDHSATLSGLSPNVRYFYVVMTHSAQNVLTSSAESNFTTPNVTVPPPALVGSPSSSGITASQATISWTTNPAGDSTVSYGTAPGNYTFSASDPNHTQTTSHSLTLSGLTPITQYFYKVQSTNAAGTMTSGEFSFTTLNTSVPVISGVQSADVSENAASIRWTTDVASTSQVKYGTTPGSYPNQTTPDSNALLSHSVSLSALTPATRYYFVVVSGNSAGTATSAESNFTTHDSQGGNPVDHALVGTFIDGFTSFDPSKWTVSTATVDDTADDYAGVLRLTPTAGNGAARVYVDSLKTWSLVGSSVTVNTLEVVDAGGSVNCKFNFHAPGNAGFSQAVGFWYESGNLNAYYIVDGIENGVATVPYSPLNHASWRIRESGGTIYWETSPDRVNWAPPVGQIATSALHFDLTQGVVGFNVSAFGTGNPSPGVAAFANLNVAPSPLSTFHDGFAFVDADTWYVAEETTGSTVSASNGVLSLAPEPGNPGGSAAVIGFGTYALTGSSFSVKVPQAVSGANVNQVLRLAPGPFAWTRSLGFWLENGNLFAYVETNETPTAIATLTYSPVTHAFWRVRESGGTIFWDTSSDGVTWTNRGQAPVSTLSFSPSSVSIFMTTHEFHTGNPNPGIGQFSNVNQ